MSSSPPFHVPHSTTSNDGYAFTCPNCADIFASSDDVIRHLSTTVTCSQRVVQGLTSDFGEPSHFSQDYDPDDLEHEQGGACISLDQWRLNFSMHLVYGEYEGLDTLDDAEEVIIPHVESVTDDVSAYNPPLSSVPHPSTPESACDTPLASVDPSAGPRPSTFREYHPNAPITHHGGENHLQKMDCNVHSTIHHTENLYYPFASKAEFDLGYWLSEGASLQKEVDMQTKNNPPSFNTSKDLRARIEGLPEVPRWYHQQIKVGSYKTKAPLVLYWRDGLEVVKHLFANPVFGPCMNFQLYQEFEGADGQQAYGEFMSADLAWEIQDKLPPGHSFIGVIGALDKTPLTIGTRNKEMHPLLILLANIHAGIHMKTTSHAFALVAYLPIPKFLNVLKPIHAILST
ncbi:hypothetical protein EDB19DRAFT_1904877 [Suillus lakei]|nr:hypothetical protein EDB19DRAFT_1904877 [Suillus lakei]